MTTEKLYQLCLEGHLGHQILALQAILCLYLRTPRTTRNLGQVT